jgi:hypothetical protein
MDLMTEFWSSDKTKLQEFRTQLSRKLLEVTHIEGLKYRQMWASEFYRTDCSQVDIFVQQYLVLHIFAMFKHFRNELIAALPDEATFVRQYWNYLQRCCLDSLKVECTVAVEKAIPDMVASLRKAWETRTIPLFQTFQIEYDPALFETTKEPPPSEPIKRGRPKQTGKRKKME